MLPNKRNDLRWVQWIAAEVRPSLQGHRSMLPNKRNDLRWVQWITARSALLHGVIGVEAES
jgi:hypothetical protein